MPQLPSDKLLTFRYIGVIAMLPKLSMFHDPMRVGTLHGQSETHCWYIQELQAELQRSQKGVDPQISLLRHSEAFSHVFTELYKSSRCLRGFPTLRAETIVIGCQYCKKLTRPTWPPSRHGYNRY